MRFVPKSRQYRDADTDQFICLAEGAFTIRESDEGGLSVTWIEYYGVKNIDSKRCAAIAFRASLDSQRLGGEGVFASAKVDDILKAGREFEKPLRVVHDPVPQNPGHAQIRQFSDDDLMLLDVLATEVFSEIDRVSTLNLP